MHTFAQRRRIAPWPRRPAQPATGQVAVNSSTGSSAGGNGMAAVIAATGSCVPEKSPPTPEHCQRRKQTRKATTATVHESTVFCGGSGRSERGLSRARIAVACIRIGRQIGAAHAQPVTKKSEGKDGHRQEVAGTVRRAAESGQIARTMLQSRHLQPHGHRKRAAREPERPIWWRARPVRRTVFHAAGLKRMHAAARSSDGVATSSSARPSGRCTMHEDAEQVAAAMLSRHRSAPARPSERMRGRCRCRRR